jgi:hypothetical protein
MSALAADHRNDVVATIVALVFGIIGMILNKKWSAFYLIIFFLGSKAIDGEIKPRELSVIDPVGMSKTFFITFFH